MHYILPYPLLGQQRSRMLATLFKDERCQQLATYGILEKMYLDRIIRGNQLQEFAAMLMPHQKATTADGESNHNLDASQPANLFIWVMDPNVYVLRQGNVFFP